MVNFGWLSSLNQSSSTLKVNLSGNTMEEQ